MLDYSGVFKEGYRPDAGALWGTFVGSHSRNLSKSNKE
jgi:hypothetical protein